MYYVMKVNNFMGSTVFGNRYRKGTEWVRLGGCSFKGDHPVIGFSSIVEARFALEDQKRGKDDMVAVPEEIFRLMYSHFKKRKISYIRFRNWTDDMEVRVGSGVLSINREKYKHQFTPLFNEAWHENQ